MPGCSLAWSSSRALDSSSEVSRSSRRGKECAESSRASAYVVDAFPMALAAPGMAFAWVGNEARAARPSRAGPGWPPGLAVAGEIGRGGSSGRERWREFDRGQRTDGCIDRNGRARIGRIPSRARWAPRGVLRRRGQARRETPGCVGTLSPGEQGWNGRLFRTRVDRKLEASAS